MLVGGLVRICEIIAGQSDDTLEGGRVLIADGEEEEGRQEAAAVIDSATIDVVDGLVRLTLVARFGPDVANFDWRVREVRTAQGVALDRVVEDQGRKAPPTTWTTVAELDFIPDELG